MAHHFMYVMTPVGGRDNMKQEMPNSWKQIRSQLLDHIYSSSVCNFASKDM